MAGCLAGPSMSSLRPDPTQAPAVRLLGNIGLDAVDNMIR